MDSQLNPEVEQRINALCDEIAVAHDLDDDLREELRGHVEDKVLGYLSGDVAVGEDDAFILAKEHFGDRRRLKGMLSDVHHVEATGALWRRIAAAAIVYVCARHCVALGQACYIWFAGFVGSLAADASSVTIGIVPLYRTQLAVPLLLGLLLGYWRWRERKGHRMWYSEWQSRSLIAALAASFALLPAVGGASAVIVTQSQGPLHFTSMNVLSPLFAKAVWGASEMAAAVLLLWWCDSRPRRMSALLATAASWVVVAGLLWILADFMRFNYTAGSVVEAWAPGGWPDATLIRVGDSGWGWFLPGARIFRDLGAKLLVSTACAGAALYAYRFLSWTGSELRARFGTVRVSWTRIPGKG